MYKMKISKSQTWMDFFYFLNVLFWYVKMPCYKLGTTVPKVITITVLVLLLQ